MKNKNFLAMLAFLSVFAVTPVLAEGDEADTPPVEAVDDVAPADANAADTESDASSVTSDDESVAKAPEASEPADDTKDEAKPAVTIKDIKKEYSEKKKTLKKECKPEYYEENKKKLKEECAQKLVDAGLATDVEEAKSKLFPKKKKKKGPKVAK